MEDAKKKELITEALNLVDGFINKVELFESCRPASICLTKIEEAMMWFQVLASNAALKESQYHVDTE